MIVSHWLSVIGGFELSSEISFFHTAADGTIKTPKKQRLLSLLPLLFGLVNRLPELRDCGHRGRVQ
jgi:hypothetical protein